jgi:zinc transporter, ZIP family
MSQTRTKEGVSVSPTRALPKWLLAIVPLTLLAILVGGFVLLDPLSTVGGELPPIEELSVQRVEFPGANQVRLTVVNGGPDPVTIAQVLVDDAYWFFEMTPATTLRRLEQATLEIPYPWVDGEPLVVSLLTSTGVTFEHEVELAVESPSLESRTFINYGLLGVYVGIVPVALGLLWYPFMRRIDRKWMNALLALTVGLLVFLLIDTLLEALELAAVMPGVFQGTTLVVFSTLFALAVLMVVGRRKGSSRSPMAIATLIALGIGLHNLGEGLAIGAAFASGAAALGSFLVVGFTLHNITEGVGIAAPLVRGQTPSWRSFVGLAMLAGAPAIAGTWIGGLAFLPLMSVIFLSLGAGAILQVIWEVSQLLVRDARLQERPVMSWLNLGGLSAGVLIMYVTAFLVKF